MLEATVNGDIDLYYQQSISSCNMFDTIKVMSLKGWTFTHVQNIGTIFPQLKRLIFDLGSDSTRNPIPNFQNILVSIWCIPLQKLYLKYLEADKYSAVDWNNLGPPTFLRVLQELTIKKEAPRDFWTFLEANLVHLQNIQIFNTDICPVDNNCIQRIAKFCPNLIQLQIDIYGENYNFCFSSLRVLKLRIKCTSASATCVTFQPDTCQLDGNLPSLETFKLCSNSLSITIEPRLLNSTQLKSVKLGGEDAYNVVNILQKSWSKFGKFPHISISANPHAEHVPAGSFDIVVKLIQKGFTVANDSVTRVIGTLEQFVEVKEFLLNQNIHDIFLQPSVHAYLLQDLPLLCYFTSLRSVEICNSNDVTQDGFSTFLKNSLSLEFLSMSHGYNTNFNNLKGKSTSLKVLKMRQFHTLLQFDLDMPVLENLRLDSCDGETVHGQAGGHHPNSQETYGNDRWCPCFGNFGERVLKALLNGSESMKLPALKELYVGHNPNQPGGSPPVYEELRVEIDCTAGHANLQKLNIYNCMHLRSLELKNVPNLVEFGYSTQSDGEQDNWLETLQLGVPAKCKIEVENIADTPKLAYLLRNIQ